MKYRFFSFVAKVTYLLGFRKTADKYALKSIGADIPKAKELVFTDPPDDKLIDLIRSGLIKNSNFTVKRTKK